MAGELNWDESRKQREMRKGLEYLTTMGLPDSILDESAVTTAAREGFVNLQTTRSLDFVDPASYYRRGQFSAEEIGAILSAFSEFDVHGDGHIEVKDIQPLFEAIKVPMPESGIASFLEAANIKHTDPGSSVEFEQIFDVLGEIKEATNAKGRKPSSELKLNQIPTHRSGGSL
ncbi:mitochondrial glycerol-3-phosphate dehydrogenase [Coemansia brasiliensis]|uniref:Mitochondrial glycerol-3-phosphate dehydrogenase n=1 Tax=Coemansia brasiliensis TaxID=2650707 RepID=A0A9W8I634_9FUNG|nr:mitochondrial glycerol-3-phosphate dehydrogenase [Coemansia brasiliensis]